LKFAHFNFFLANCITFSGASKGKKMEYFFTQTVKDRIYFHLKGKKMEYFFTQTVKERIYFYLKDGILFLQV
jgi:hypothetical protein